MIEQLKILREFVEAYSPSRNPSGAEALTALTQLEAMVGAQEPVAKLHDDGYWTPMKTEAGRALNDRLMRAGSPSIDVYATPVAQQPQARPDFADEWTGYLKDGETPFERFMRERKDLDALTKLYQRALEENERLKAQQPQAEAVPADIQRLKAVVAAFGPGAPVQFAQDTWAGIHAAIAALIAAPQQAEAVPPGFVAFARDVLADFPNGFPDGFDLNDLAIKHGLLIGKTVTERCGEFCNCAEYHGEDKLKGGVTCYHRHAAIAQQKGGQHE